MKNGNRISAALPATDKQQIIKQLKEAAELLDFLVTLAPEESRSLRNIGVDGVPFALAGLSFTRRSFDLAEYERDVQLMHDLREIRAVLAPLSQKLEDTYRLVGADVMVTTDDIYEDLSKDKGETAAVQAPYQQMRKRYQYRQGAQKAAKPRSLPVPIRRRLVRHPSRMVPHRSVGSGQREGTAGSKNPPDLPLNSINCALVRGSCRPFSLRS